MAMSPYGTLEILDAIADVQTSVIAYGEDVVYREIQRALDAHNTLVRELVPELCEVTEQYILPYGGNDDRFRMEDGDEYGQEDVQKGFGAATNMGIPLGRARLSIQWTRDWLEEHTVAQLVAQYQMAQEADIRYIQKKIQTAFFSRDNRLAVKDKLATGLALDLRAFLNADGQPIPSADDGTSFDPNTHTHYTASAGPLTPDDAGVAVLKNVLTNVVEHDTKGDVRIYINRQEESAVWGMVGAFFPFVDPNIQQSSAAAYAIGQTLDLDSPNNRAIGRFDSAIVHVKPWIPAGYIVALDLGSAGRKPLAFRVRPGGVNADLRIRAEHEHFPLRAQHISRDFGIGVFNRDQVAIHQVNAPTPGGVPTYAVPTF